MGIHQQQNCSIVITQTEKGKVKTEVFNFDDYRIATAIANLLHNMSFVYYSKYTQKGE